MLNREKAIKINNILEENIKNNNSKLIASVCAGSHSYGLETEKSDIDLRGIHAIDLKELLNVNPLTPQSKKATIEIKNGDLDINSTEIGKFCYLCLRCNPTILELLFSDNNMVIKDSDIFQLLKENRHKFLSKDLLFSSYIGYIISQTNRLPKGSLLNNLRNSYNGKYKVDLFGNINEQIEVIKQNRDIYDSLEYDYKNSMHSLRLAISIKNVLENGEILVNVGDNRELLLNIKKGMFCFGEFMEILFKEFYNFDNIYNDSTIEKEYDPTFINDILFDYRMKEIN